MRILMLDAVITIVAAALIVWDETRKGGPKQ